MNYLILQIALDGGVPLEHSLVIIEPFHPTFFVLLYAQGRWLISRILWVDKGVSRLG